MFSHKEDRLFRDPLKKKMVFEFNHRVADVFDDMLRRSIPFYDDVHSVIADVLDYRFPHNGRLYDLGCSTGNTLFFIGRYLQKKSHNGLLIGIDSAKPMVEKARQKLIGQVPSEYLTLLCDDVLEAPIDKADFVILNYTLQFIPVRERSRLLQKIYRGLNTGGVLFLSEKLHSQDKEISDLLTMLYYDFKKRNGYSELEISQKREALEKVLTPLTLREQLDLLQEAGFSRSEIVFRRYNFGSFLCIK